MTGTGPSGRPSAAQWEEVIMLDAIVPACVIVVERFADEPDVWLYPEEEEVIRRAVAKRRNEFATVRHCARAALARLGIASRPLLPGPRGAPTWPEGVVGSLTHCDGYRAAAVARSTDLRTLGIDAEEHLDLPVGVLDLVSSPTERDHLTQLAAAS
jgi:4'-phosphopantetheinyl transferase EntD